MHLWNVLCMHIVEDLFLVCSQVIQACEVGSCFLVEIVLVAYQVCVHTPGAEGLARVPMPFEQTLSLSSRAHESGKCHGFWYQKFAQHYPLVILLSQSLHSPDHTVIVCSVLYHLHTFSLSLFFPDSLQFTVSQAFAAQENKSLKSLYPMWESGVITTAQSAGHVLPDGVTL